MIIAILMTTAVFAVLVAVPMNASAGTIHAPIEISSDANFADAGNPLSYGVTGGSGTESDPYIISGWNISSSTTTGIYIQYASVYFTIENCNITGDSSQNAIVLNSNSHGKVLNCSLTGNSYGVYSYDSRTEVLNCTISGGNTGIYSYNDVSIVSRGNNLSNFVNYAIYSDYSKAVSFVDNDISSGYVGIYISRAPGQITAMLGNDISDCPQSAIIVTQSRNARVFGNNITDCGYYAIQLEDCLDSMVFHNDINSSGYAEDYGGSGNQWDNGYPSGGNYWVQAPHIDVFSGADQLTPAPLGDGISDTPVTFWDSAADKYPLNASFSGNVEPVAGFNLTKRVLNTTTSLYMNASLSVDVEDPLSALQFRWDFEGDLAWDTAFSPTMDASHTYAVEGNYTVRLEVQDSGGLTGIATQDIVVSNNAHDTIYIYSDSDFTNPNSTTGVTWGSGTEADPYIISGWVIDATEDAGIYIEYTTAYFIIRDCRVYFGGFEYSGIYLYQAQNGKIETCIAGMNNFGIEMYYGENVEITGCNVTDNFQRGIYCYGSNDTLIRGNNASLNGYSGIHMYYSDNSLISNNTVNNRSDYGIYVYECFNLTILRNNLSGHLQYGVFAQWSERLNIVRNEFIGNPTGVYDVYTDGVNIIGNNFTGEFYDGSYYGGGVYLEVDNGASVHHNNFINLNMYAYDPGISTWDAGYPLGGNYWDIFTYPGDVNSGPAQNIPGADGIVDMPLGIDADSWDHYPLIAPFNMSNLPPIPAIATSAGIVNTSTVLYVDGIGSFDVEDPASALRVRWDWESDGTWDTSWSTTKTASHTYSIEGIYTITMEVNDTGGSVTSTTAMVVVDDMYRVTNIHIKGDTQFNVTNGVNGGGDGSAGNPYVIQNYVLDATNSRGIWIEHTDAYFVIQNVHVFYGEINSIEGIRLDDVQNGSIVLSSFMDNHYGIELQSSGNVSVSDCVFESCYMSIYGYQSDYLDFARLTSANTTDNSLYFGSYCDFITISDCDISHARQSGISFGGNSHDVQIMNASLDSTYYGIYCYEVSRLGITDCNVTSSYYAIMAYFSDNCTISNNEVFSSRYGMYLYDIENTLIDYNYLNATVQYGIFIYSTSRNIMVDNCHLNGNGNGIRIYSSGEYITISNCTAKNVNYGVYANSVTNISVRLNNFTGAGTYGVEVVQSSYFEIIGNNLSGTVYGAYVSNSNAFNILENSMWNNSNYGVFLSGCLDGRVKNNVVAGALSYGIYMSSCTAMMVAGNNLIENVNQAYDDNGPQNHWNETAAYGGGNYWSNYTFPDANADGFGDTPALIDLVDSADYLPLMSPWVPKQDVEAPVTTIALSGTIGTNGWYTSDVILNLTATDDFSGVKWTKYMIGTGAWVTYTANVTMLTDGSYVLTYCSEDKSGNDEDNKTVTVKIDKTLPTLTINQTSGMTVSKNYSVISWLGSDATSGIDHFEIKIDGGSFASVGLAMSHNFTLLTDGTHNVTVKAVDKAGHEYNTSIQFTVIAETAGGGTSGDLLTYGLIIVIIIVVVVALLMVMRRGKKPSPKLDEMKSEPPTPPAD
jgi:parallel beta-helix repeat protein